MPNSEVILAIIRQESEFDKSANSWAGARGMMQLMKYTAKIVAKQAKLPYSISGLTRDPEYNIKLGSYYFNSLIEDYMVFIHLLLQRTMQDPIELKHGEELMEIHQRDNFPILTGLSRLDLRKQEITYKEF